jgi:hypothetical protein
MKLLKPYLDAQVLKLARVLETPSLGGSSEQHNGWIALSQGGANWMLAAQKVVNALQGAHHAKATGFTFRVGRAVIRAHAWYDRPPHYRNPPDPDKVDDAQYMAERERRARQYQEQDIGSYCVAQAIRQGFCSLDYSNHKDFGCAVILLPGDSPLRREPSDYTQPHPFPNWTSQVDMYGHELVKTDIGTDWVPGDWHFTGRPPLPNEDRLWHDFQDRMRREDPNSGTDLLSLSQPVSYKVPWIQPHWVRAVHNHERIPFRINAEMLQLLKDLDYQEPELELDPYRVVNHASRLAEDGFFYQRIFLDKRGRMFTSRSDLHYQDDDQTRCLIEFQEGKEVDDDGYTYLLFHAANLYDAPVEGVAAKAYYGFRHLEQFIRYAENPVSTYDEWQVNDEDEQLDDPFQFIRACMELRDATDRGSMSSSDAKPKAKFLSHLPIEVDQSNSVIQHLSLFYGDRDTALISNLLQLGDIYNQIAESWNIAVPGEELSAHRRRNVIKKIVVPRCYGSGPERIADEALANLPYLDGLDRDAKITLATEGIERIERLVPVIPQFRLEVGRLLRSLNLQPSDEVAWSTISGFEVHIRPVHTNPSRMELPRSREERHRRVQLRVNYATEYLHRRDLASGLQAHIVHSTDASLAHMLLANVTYPVIAIHDAFAAHASNVHDLRTEFVYNLMGVHISGAPYQNFRYEVAGEPSPLGLLGYDEVRARTFDILNEIVEQGFLEMIG